MTLYPQQRFNANKCKLAAAPLAWEGACASAVTILTTAGRKGARLAPALNPAELSRPSRHCRPASCACEIVKGGRLHQGLL
jgi:hypothetical protein